MKVGSSAPLTALQQEMVRHGKIRANIIVAERMKKDALIATKKPYIPHQNKDLKSLIDHCGETIRNLGKIVKEMKQQDTRTFKKDPEFYVDL